MTTKVEVWFKTGGKISFDSDKSRDAAVFSFGTSLAKGFLTVEDESETMVIPATSIDYIEVRTDECISSR